MNDELSREEKKHLLSVNQENRAEMRAQASTFLNLSYITLPVFLSLIAIEISVIGINRMTIGVIGAITIPFIMFWIWASRKQKKAVKGAKKYHKQYKKYFLDLYPDKGDEI